MTDEVLQMIGTADDCQISQIVLAVLDRYRKLFPNQEVIFLSLPTDDPAERRRILEYASRALRKGNECVKK